MVTHTDEPPESPELQQALLESRDRFLAFVRSRVDDPELAEDILQDSLLRAIQAAPSLRQEDRLVAWFYRVLQNAIIDAYRRRGVASQRHVPLEGVDLAADVESETLLCACFEPLIATLKPEYAHLIRTVDLGSETPESAARRLGVTSSNLKVRRRRARQALRQRLEQTCRSCAEHGCIDCTCRPD